MTGWAYVDIIGPIVNHAMVRMSVPKEIKITKIEAKGPIHAWNGPVDPLKGPVIIAWEYLVYYEYDKKDEKIIKEWSDRNDHKRRPKL